MRMWNLFCCVFVAGCLALLPSAVLAESWCGAIPGHGKDYITNKKALDVVERYHFTNDVRMLRRGASGYIANDLDYVLNHFPNHHAALDAFSRLAIREGTSKPTHAQWNIECRFYWARTVNSNDAMVPFIQGLHHYRQGKMGQAREYLEQSVNLNPDNPEVLYNLGVILVKLGDHEEARLHAQAAYAMGHPLPGLRNMLERAGYPLSATEAQD
ncbi:MULTISPECIES: tetratricopeptide repeat protein [unclassified Ectothiorhodospira]|uniref:tetratricopeptide repeat protein n=1 Tax=unclassified Ectothiorhodospira TaxID=2684909 RepID=UPI001EE88DF1|nr:MULTISPECIES: tetratricopeptide repeat protein [unclassified Ectothiorhodospira]MCG5517092.1 tetratricopeptide repeat protein [Ectothiorhodospira sp. 9100]MCG5519754.1 tetratricopeptide repeat protein [Ectothiorhodospira sp. 9905]